MKKKTKFGLLLAAVATATFYVVHKIAGKKAPAKAPVAHVETTTAPPAPATSPPHGGSVTQPNPATPTDPSAPLPGQADPGVHFDQPGAASPGSTFVDTTQSGKEHPQPFQAPSDPSQYDQGKKKPSVVYQNPDGSKSSVDPTTSQGSSPVSDFVDSLNPWA